MGFQVVTEHNEFWNRDQRKTRRKFSAEEKIRIVLEGLRGEETIAGKLHREVAHLDRDHLESKLSEKVAAEPTSWGSLKSLFR